MARPTDNSLKYYNQDTKDDDNLQYIEAVHGLQGYAIVHKLWKHIYGGPGGYYAEWSEINQVLFCKKNGITMEFLQALVGACCTHGIEIFDPNMIQVGAVLTSKGVQKRWLKIVTECGRKNRYIIDKYRLIENEYVINEGANGIENTAAVGFRSMETPQSKVKESKVKETNGIGQNEILHPPAPGPDKSGEKKKTRIPGAVKVPYPENASEVENFMWAMVKHVWDRGFCNILAAKFFNHYTSNGWKQSRGNKIISWHHSARNWIFDEQKKNKQPTYTPKNNHVSEETKPANEFAPTKTTVAAQLTDFQKNAKTESFIQAVYIEFCKGLIEESSIAYDIYQTLQNKGLINLTPDEKTTLLAECEGDQVKAKKRAVANYFTSLKNLGKKRVFPVTIPEQASA